MKSGSVRFGFSLLLAVTISLLIFSLMYQLIRPDSADIIKQPAATVVDISRVREQPKQQQQKQQQQKPEPTLQPLTLAPSGGVPVIKQEPQLEVDAISWDNPELQLQQKYWNQPAGSTGNSYEYADKLERGQKELIPVSTSRPNIPQVAFDNRINGWVMLAYAVTNKGRVTDIRVMDASPRGVFEANAIAAVQKWIYQPYSGPVRYVSQRIDFEWNMFHYNMDIR